VIAFSTARGLPLVALIWLLSSAAANAQPNPTGRDYDLDNSEWNGLAELARLLEATGREVVPGPIDLAAVPIDEPVLLIHPRGALDPAALRAFVEAGGRVLIADDFGSGVSAMAELGVRVAPSVRPHRSYFRQNPDLPVLSPSQASADHPLLDEVDQVLTNHPRVLTSSDLDPLLPYERRRDGRAPYGLLYEWRPGERANPEGRALLLGDPSVLINLMLDTADNRTLAMNVVRYLCEGHEPCRLHVAVTDAPVYGTVTAVPEEADGLGDVFADRFSRVNELLQGISNYRPSPRGVYLASVFLGVGVAVFLFSALPLAKPRWLEFSLRRERGVRSRSEFEWNLERLLRQGRDGDYALPLAILKDEFEELFLRPLARDPGELELEQRYQPEQMRAFAARYASRTLPDAGSGAKRAAAGKCLATLELLASLPSRTSLVPEVDARYSERLFKRVYGETHTLLRGLGILEQYERRTGRP